MKREIKFRIWTGNQMDYQIMAGYLGAYYVAGIDSKDSACMSPFNTKYNDEFHTPMQFTGLKDKNGKDIFESDLLKSHDREFCKEEDVIAVKWGRTGFVVYSPNCCDVCKNGFGCIGNLDEFPNEWEVIGNLFENPELIKV